MGPGDGKKLGFDASPAVGPISAVANVASLRLSQCRLFKRDPIGRLSGPTVPTFRMILSEKGGQ
jgi:hypothetical protein